MMFGATVLWAIILWMSRSRFYSLFSYVYIRDVKRLGRLQSALHANFIFKEKEGIQRKAYFFLFAGIFIALVSQSVFVFILVVIGFLTFPKAWTRIIEMIRANKFQRQLLLFVPSLSSLLKSGHGLERALHQLKTSSEPPMSDEIGYVLKEIRVGTSLEEAFYRLAQRFQSENMTMLVHALSISRKLGTSLSEVIDHIAKNILEKEKLKQQILSLTSQGKMQAWVATAMPLFVTGAMRIISPDYFRPLIETTAGQVCLGYCAISMTAGLLWIYQITHQEYL